MQYLLFEKSALELLVSKTEFQSTEFMLGQQFIDCVGGHYEGNSLSQIFLQRDDSERGIQFIGHGCEKKFLLIDLTQCNILNTHSTPDETLCVFQKVFRTVIRVWETQPFTAWELIRDSKVIVFPFGFKNRYRAVIERTPENILRLTRRGIERPLLIYKYGTDGASTGEENPETRVLIKAGESYLQNLSFAQNFFRDLNQPQADTERNHPVISNITGQQFASNSVFLYEPYERQMSQITETQKKVIKNPDTAFPIRIEGAAGTGKTASMVLRAYTLLRKKKEENQPFEIAFFTHSESTKTQVEKAFSYLDDSGTYTKSGSRQHIMFSSLFSYCIQTSGLREQQVIDKDVRESKDYQRMLIQDALDEARKEKLRTFKPLLSNELRLAFDENVTLPSVLIAMLQHEFSVQIKGRANGDLSSYKDISSIKNALPVKNEKDKEFIFSIFNIYEDKLKTSSVYDSDDVTIAATLTWISPIWRRERVAKGFHYIFVDEMHLFNLNEQLTFHYLTRTPDHQNIPICFALDYGQAIGDRGDTRSDYIEHGFGEMKTDNKLTYKTVFRCSPQIADFCDAVAISGALMFKDDYKPMDAQSGFTAPEEHFCETPRLRMIYDWRNQRDKHIKEFVEQCRKGLLCKNREIAIISFDDDLFQQESRNRLSAILGAEVFLLSDSYTSMSNKEDSIILASPYDVNGLEFKCVILVGVDEGRLPQTTKVGDISSNYIKYTAFNQLYLTASRAKYRLMLLGDAVRGVSSCLEVALEHKRIELEET